MTDDDVKERVKEATDIIAVVGQFVTLKKRGMNFLGLCPFHTEKTPSFTVHPDRQFFHCFGCGKGGDVFTFLMEHEGWSFPEALKYCADRAGITLPTWKRDDDAQSQRRQDIAAALALADAIYRRALFSPQGQGALAYLNKRGFAEATLRKAGVGYAPPAFDTITNAARARGIGRDVLEAAGLTSVSAKGGSPYDRFRNRITFPIINLSGKTVGFGARVLSDDDQPKYLNSPETALYQKSRILYGLATTRDAIRREDRAIIVEGYLDWLTMIEYGVENVVAVSGTALTTAQTELLSRFCKQVTLMFDADAAGQRAALRGIELAYNAGLSVDVAVLPGGDDPDSFLRREGKERLAAIVQAAPGIVEYRVQRETAAASGGRLDFMARERLVKEFLALAALITDATRRDTFLGEVAGFLDVSEEKLRRSLRPSPSTRAGAESTPRGLVRREEEFLRVLLEDPTYPERARDVVTPEDFVEPLHRRMYASLLARALAGAVTLSPTDLGTDADEVVCWSRLLSVTIDPAVRERMFVDALAEFRQRRRRADLPHLKARIAQAERAGDRETAARLLAEFNREWRSGDAEE
ncbi:MAG: DNA primase [Candidatus Zixiibacteriota bacterium]